MGPGPPSLVLVKKKSQKEEKPAGQATKKPSHPLAQGLDPPR